MTSRARKHQFFDAVVDDPPGMAATRREKRRYLFNRRERKEVQVGNYLTAENAKNAKNLISAHILKPARTTENSPVLQRWAQRQSASSPKGRQKSSPQKDPIYLAAENAETAKNLISAHILKSARTTENSPVLQRWAQRQSASSPKGRQKSLPQKDPIYLTAENAETAKNLISAHIVEVPQDAQK